MKKFNTLSSVGLKTMVIFMPLILNGCANTSKIIENLQQPTTKSIPVHLDSNICTNAKSSFGREAEVCLLQGTYRIEKENDIGQFFLGELPSVYWRNGKTFKLVNGGVWLPRDTSAPMRVYYHIADDPMIMGDSLRDIEVARLKPAPAPAGVSDPMAIPNAINRATPQNASIVGASVGGAAAEALIMLLLEAPLPPALFNEALTPSFIDTVRGKFYKTGDAP